MFTLETDTRCNNLCYNDTFAYYPLWLALSASVAEKVIEKYQRMVKKEGSLPGIGCKTLLECGVVLYIISEKGGNQYPVLQWHRLLVPSA